jgi:septum site-determining protein MinC
LSTSTASSPVRPRTGAHLRGRSYILFALIPEPPLADWLAELDSWRRGAPGLLNGRAVVLDLSAVTLTHSGIQHLVSQLAERDISILGIEGVAPDKIGPGLPPLLTSGRTVTEGSSGTATAPTASADSREPSSVVIDSHVRSGQSVCFPQGDVVVLGSVGSGAEIIAGGSIHVYGTLRGRAIAGAAGDRQARIFCRRIEAELLAIDGYYRTAENLEPNLRDRPVQAWLVGETLMIASME